MNHNTLFGKPFRFLALATLVLGGSAWADSVKSDYDHNAHFSQLHTYSWGQVKTADPLYADRVKQKVDQELQAKGWQVTPSGGEATVFATGEIHHQQELQTTYDSFGPGWGGWGWGADGGFGESTTTPINQPVARLVIDIFNSNQKNVLWRGIIQRDPGNNAEKNTKSLDKDLDKLFKDFPPKGKP